MSLIWRLATIGAITFGLLGFAAGVAICITFKLPIPPVAITEVTAVLGGGLGALVGWCWPDPVRRLTLAGVVAGFAAGLLWCCVRDQFEPLAWLAYVGLGAWLGNQAASSERRTGEPWRLYR